MVLLESELQVMFVNDKVPQFTLKNVEGSMISPSQFEGKILLVIFMCNHCPFVKKQLDEIISLQNDFASKDVVVIGINSNDPTDYPEDDFEHMQALAKEIGLKYYLVDETQEVAKLFGATCTPDPFVFDKNHKLRYHGKLNDALTLGSKPKEHTMREVLTHLVEGKPIGEWFRPSMGCSIKWRK